VPTELYPDDPAFQRMVAAFEGDPEPWLALNRALRDAMVSYAVERTPYYRSLSGRPFEDLPLLTKDVLRGRFEDLIAEGVPPERWARDATSGSRGPAVSFIRDTAQGPLENVSALRFLKWMEGIPPDATRVWISSAPEIADPDASTPHGDPETHPVRTQGLTPDRLRSEVEGWARFHSYYLYGHASVMAWIADRIAAGDVSLPASPAGVVTTADTLTDHGAGRLSRAFGAPVHSWYGSREVNGFVAGTLPESRRYAFNPLLVYLEVLDDSGRPATPGETGRVILTDLNNLVMPFIRYDIGDLAVASHEGSVGGFPLIEDLAGRDVELLEFPGGTVLNGITLGRTLFVEHDLGEDIGWYQLAKTGDNEVELRVIWARRPTRRVRAAAAEAVRGVTDPDTIVKVRAIEALGRLPSGKAWVLRDETG